MADTDFDRWAWIPDEEHSWIPAKVIRETPEQGIYQTLDNQKVVLDAKTMEKCTEAHGDSINELHNNLTTLSEFNEGAILYQIRKRYSEDQIYTYIGNILISVNPFKELDIYVLSVLQMYRSRTKLDELDPHVYAVACTAYWNLMEHNTDQAVVISGESGAGKTEATKLVLQFMSEVAGSKSGVEQQILLSNPILEAFGNAKTLRNNNSSRFGKWLELNFDTSTRICGAKIINYLLEKIRVVHQTPDERNYHIFYQLCAGSDPDQRDKYHIWSHDKFHYLNQSGCYEIKGVEDASEFGITITALNRLGFTAQECENIVKALAMVLHLGNLQFKAVEGSDGSEIINKVESDICSKLMGMSNEDFEKTMCFRSVTIVRELQLIGLKQEEAVDARDSLAKAIYGNLFDFLVIRINDYLCKESGRSTIGVLDIFGFEVFEVNSFEQFCINFTNEQLQQFFNVYIFKMEKDEYAAENVEIGDVSYIENQACLDLITGILGKIDEEIKLPKGSDTALIEKMHSEYSFARPKNPFYDMKRQKNEEFIIKHFAGSVNYVVDGFLEKNKDNVHESVIEAMQNTKEEILKILFKSTDEPDASGKRKRKPKTKTLGSKFKKQLDELMTALRSKTPHFIRCIKPNHLKVSDNFSSPMILAQMRCAGLFECVKLRAAGYANRKPHLEFWTRFRIILGAEDNARVEAMVSAKDKCEAFLKVVAGEVNVDLIRIGKTKVFYKNDAMSQLETMRQYNMESSSILVNSITRGIFTRRILKKLVKKCLQSKAEKTGKSIEELMKAQLAHENETGVSGIHSFVMSQLKNTYESSQEEQRILKMLRESTISKDLNILEGALANAENMQLEKKSHNKQVLRALQDAKSTYNLLCRRREVRKELMEAYIAEDMDALKTALDKAEELAIPSKETSEARELLAALEKEVRLMKALEKALEKSWEVAKIEECVSQCQDISRMTDARLEVIKKAKVVVAEEYNRIVDAAIPIEDEEEAKSVMERIQTHHFVSDFPEIISKISEFLSAMEEKRARIRAALDKIQRGIEQESLELLKEGIQAAKELGVSDEEFIAGQALLSELEYEEEVVKRLVEAMAGDDIDVLEERLKATRLVSRMNDYRNQIFQQATDMIFSHYRDALEKCISEIDEDGCRKTVELIKKKRVVRPPLSGLDDYLKKAEDFIKKMENTRKALSAAVESENLDVLAEAIENARNLRIDTMDAEVLLSELGREKEIFEKLTGIAKRILANYI